MLRHGAVEKSFRLIEGSLVAAWHCLWYSESDPGGKCLMELLFMLGESSFSVPNLGRLFEFRPSGINSATLVHCSIRKSYTFLYFSEGALGPLGTYLQS